MNLKQGKELRDKDRVEHHDPNSGHQKMLGVIYGQQSYSRANKTRDYSIPANFHIKWDDEDEPDDHVTLSPDDSDSLFLLDNLTKI